MTYSFFVMTVQVSFVMHILNECILQVNVQQRFQELSEILNDQYTEEDRQIVACPRAEQVSVS